MRKKFVLSLFGVFAALAVLYGIWWLFPQERNAEVVTDAYRVTNEWLEKSHTLAEDPGKNGFINPTFLPYWGRKGIEHKEDSEAGEIVVAWQNYSTPSADNTVDHKALLEQKDEGYTKALDGMKKVAPDLREAMDKSLFAPPKYELKADAVIPNLIAARACAQAMVGLAESEVAQGEVEQAAEDLVSVVSFGAGLIGQCGFLTDMVGVGIEDIGVNGFNGLIDINSNLPADTWKSLSQKMLNCEPPKEMILRAMQSEMLFCHNSIEYFKENPDWISEEIKYSPVAALPGFFSREERIYNNVMSDLILQYQSKGTLDLPKELLEPSNTDWFTGRTGSLTVLMVQDFSRSKGRLEVSRRRLIATSTAAGISAYRAQEGKLPETLAQLPEAGIPLTDDKEWLSTMEYEARGDSATLKVRIQDSPAQLFPSVRGDWEHPWLETTDEHLTYSFGPVKK